MKGTVFGLFGHMRTNKRKRASILVFVLAAIGVIGLLTGGVLNAALEQRRQAERYQIYNEEFSVAEFQLTKAFGEIGYALKKAGETSPETVINSIAPAPVAGFEIDEDHPFRIEKISDSTSVLPEGDKWAGYNLRRLTFRVYSGLVRRTDATASRFAHPGVDMQQDLQITYIPLYIFGIFYDNDLEIHPGADFEETGRVHTNSDLYYGTDGKKMDIKNYTSVAGNINYGRHKNSGKGLRQGRNRFWNGSEYVDSSYGGKNLDWTYNEGGQTWADIAQTLWKGYVRDKALGATEFNLPWPEVIPTIEIIQPPKGSDFGPLLTNKFYYKSGIRIIRQQISGSWVTKAYDAYGGEIKLTYGRNDSKSVVSTSSFYNERAGGTVRVVDLDLAKLAESGIDLRNNIIYVENKESGGAVRIINGEDLPGSESTGLSIITPGAMYVQGDYNTEYASDDPPPSMLAADAINILSDGWKDSDNDTSGKRSGSGPKPSGSVETNAVVVAGNVPTGLDGGKNKHYSGGVENFFRYMEDWNGASKQHIFKGSIINLYASTQNTGYWDSQKYSAPKRQWSWDSALARRGPPGSPNSFETVRLGWSLHINMPD